MTSFSHCTDMIGKYLGFSNIKLDIWLWRQPFQGWFVILRWNLLWTTYLPNLKSLSLPVMKIGKATQNVKNQSRAGLMVDSSWVAFNFQALVTLTLTLDRVIRHIVWHQSSASDYTPNILKSEKFFLDGLTAGTPPSSRSRDTKSRISIKNPAGTNLDIVL